jgi:hypothetical protein
MLAFLADCYSPFLIALFGFSIWQLKRNEQAQPLIKLACSLFIIYAIMLLDNIFNIWPYYKLDYSTHSAFVIVFSLQIYYLKKHLLSLLILLLISYFCVMKILNYHCFADIISTTLIILPLLIKINGGCQKRLKMKGV